MASARRPLQDCNAEEITVGVLDAQDKAETSGSTPTRVLRSGRRIPATPQVPVSTRKHPSRVPAQVQQESVRKPARRVPLPLQENEGKAEAEQQDATRRRPRRLAVAESAGCHKPGEQNHGRRKLANSPISGLIEDAGTIFLHASPPEDKAPPTGLLTEIRKAQQEICNEQKLSNLRAEIMEVQEGVRKESGSDISSAPSPTEIISSSSTNRYHDTPSSRMPHGRPFDASFEDLIMSPGAAAASSPGLRAPQNTPAVQNLVPLKNMLLNSGSSSYCGTDSEDGDPPAQPEEEQSKLNTARTGSSSIADICAKLAAIRAPELDTDGSDTADKLEALRTKTALEDAGSPEAADLLEIATIEEEEGEDCDAGPSAPDYIPRAAPGPSYMDRKLLHLQESEWSAPLETKPHKSALERAKEEAAAARRNSFGSAEKALTRKLVQQAINSAVQSEGKSLGETLVRHQSRLEKEKAAAIAAAATAPHEQGSQTAKVNKPAKQGRGQGLGEGMAKHKSRLQLEKEAAIAASGAAGSLPAKVPSYMRPTAASRHATADTSSLGDVLLVHKSRLEREKDAAKATAKTNSPRGVCTDRSYKATSDWVDLASMKVHKSRLEQEKEDAVLKNPARQASQKPASRLASMWNGGGLGNAKPHKSRLEKEKEAWAKAASKQGTARPALTPRPSVPPGRAIHECHLRHGHAAGQPSTQDLLSSAKKDTAGTSSPRFMLPTHASVARRTSNSNNETMDEDL